MIRRTLLLVALATLAACTSQKLVVAPEVDATQRVSSRFQAIEVSDVSLPNYAAGDEIYLEKSSGELAKSNLRWADTPSRAVTLALSRNLTQITGARVAPEPWPFDKQANARVEVLVERFVATGDGNLTLSGQYFVADYDGLGRDRAQLFNLSQPYGDSLSVESLATARAKLISDLAYLIARGGLR